MKHRFLLFFYLLACCFSLRGQSPEKEIARMDSLLFQVGFNQCRTEILEQVIHPDFEFYHDISGSLRGKAAFAESIRTGICKPDRSHFVRRELLDQRFFPLRKQGDVYAVLQQGRHRFFETSTKGEEQEGATALFSHLWIREGQTWKLGRSLSYDHRLSPKDIPARVDQFLQDAVSAGRFNGSVLLARGGRILLQKGYGWQDAENKVPHSEGSVFSIYSITKTFTAQVILQLVEEKKLAPDDAIERFFPGLLPGSGITVRHLLSHTSGLFNYTNGFAEKAFSEKEMIELLNTRGLNFKPGERFDYCNSGYSLLGFLAQKVEKKPFADILAERILQPLGMTESGFDFYNLRHPRKCKPYKWLGAGPPVPAPILPAAVPFAGGALFSTVGDLYRYHQGIQDRKILGSRLQNLAYQPVKENYGLGWMQNDMEGLPIVWHNGGAPGFRSVLFRNEKEDLCLVMLGNTETDITKLSEEVLAIALGRERSSSRPAPLPLPKGSAPRFEGVFRDSSGLLLQVMANEGRLFLKAPGSPPSALLYEGGASLYDPLADVPLAFSALREGKYDSLVAGTRRGNLRLSRIRLQFGLVGSATPHGWDGPDLPLEPLASGVWVGRKVSLKKGELKIRANQSWTVNFGGQPNQTWIEDGPNCLVEEGRYDVEWNDRTSFFKLTRLR